MCNWCGLFSQSSFDFSASCGGWSSRPTPTSICPAVPSCVRVLTPSQAGERSEFHRRLGVLHFSATPFQFTSYRWLWQSRQQHERGPIKKHTVLAVDAEAVSLETTSVLSMPALRRLVSLGASPTEATRSPESARLKSAHSLPRRPANEFAGYAQTTQRRLLKPTLVRSADPRGSSIGHGRGHQTSMLSRPKHAQPAQGKSAFQEADGPTDRDLQACVYETATTTLTPFAALD